MNATTRKTALVTGASAGIGMAFAHELAGRGYDLVITARRRERLSELARELSARRGVRVEIVVADLADPGAPQAIFDELAQRRIAIDMLVNNAGYGVGGTYLGTSWKEYADFLQVLVTAVAHLAHVFVPGMVQRGHGHIVNVASLAGLIYGAPGNTLYGAAKAFVIKFTESLSLELARTGVHATAVCPGFTLSEFHDVTGTRERVSRMPRAMWMDADDVAREGIDAALAGKVVYVNGGVNKLIASAMRHLPAPMARGIIKRQAKNFREVE
jgi:short-subunit dehydrogenase